MSACAVCRNLRHEDGYPPLPVWPSSPTTDCKTCLLVRDCVSKFVSLESVLSVSLELNTLRVLLSDGSALVLLDLYVLAGQ